jgi:hypothetical protein
MLGFSSKLEVSWGLYLERMHWEYPQCFEPYILWSVSLYCATREDINSVADFVCDFFIQH